MGDPTEAHRSFIATRFAKHSRRFDELLRSNPEGARAEAAICLILRSLCNRVEILESTDIGGPDFMCASSGEDFVVEATALKVGTAEDHSGLKSSNASGSFDFITDKLKSKIGRKASQVSGHSAPRLVLIYCEHSAGALLLGPDAAERILTGNLGISIPIDDTPIEPKSTTRLRDSAFFRPGSGGVQACRESVSGVLLAHGTSNECRLVGALHPAPAEVFNVALLPGVPFCTIKEWPVVDSTIEVSWVIGQPRAAVFDTDTLADLYAGAGPI